MLRKSLTYWITKEDVPYRIRTILRMRLGVSSRFLRSVRTEGDILLNGVHVRTVDYAKEGDVLTLLFPKTEPAADLPPEDIPLEILYEDGDFLALKKPAGIPVHPSKGHVSGTLLNGVVFAMDENERFSPHIINRLDKDTDGIVLIGKNAYVQEAFSALAKEGRVEKTYWAVAHSVPEPPEGTIDRPIGQPDPMDIKRAILSEEEGGYPSRTRYRTLSTVTAKDGARYSLIECNLETGRTHQIRVHLASVGCPLVGDALYGAPEEEPFSMRRQALSAVHLSFDHPITDERVAIDAALSDDMKTLLNELNMTKPHATEGNREAQNEASEAANAPGAGWRRGLFTGNITRVTAGKGGEALLILGTEKTALYDAGMACFGEEMVENLERALNGRPLDYFLISHIHYDHIGALPYVLEKYPNVVVCGASYAQETLPLPRKYEQIRALSEAAAEEFLGEGAAIPAYDDSVWRVDQVLREGDTLSLGDVTIRTIETPGHTRDSLAFYIPEWDLLIASETTGVWSSEGDVIVIFLTSYTDALRANERCEALGAKHILSPHYLELRPEEAPLYWERGRAFLERILGDLKREIAIPNKTDAERVRDLGTIYWIGTTKEEQPYAAFEANTYPQLYIVRKMMEGGEEK